MSRQDEPLTRAAIVWAVNETIRGHTGARRCPQCRPDGCEQLAWAQREQQKMAPVAVEAR
ncbi:hypothetical protein OG792_10770 [Micromonospora sp. NBC_01699]|uniref:hypothetical protein n=1 Tax=Micromonospora sp. NBC_01699 TaxID=2975984 RepID=UPI002E32171D|nr:hypothetical protein [Micromonospora sp. NBC_01699]